MNASADSESASALQWLNKMQHAISALDYQGIFVYHHGSQLESMRLVHSHVDGQEREQLIALNGESRQVVRDGNSLLCILPADRSDSDRKHSAGFNGFRATEPEKLSQYYEIRINGQERIAGRQARLLHIMPRDSLRYGLKLFLDVEHALPLKMVLLSEAGVPISQIMFTEIKFEPPDEQSLRTLDKAAGDEETAEKISIRPYDPEYSAWEFQGLPAGFDPWLYKQRKGGAQAGGVEHIVLSDGLATLSLYLEPSGADGLQGYSTVGAINAFGRKFGRFQVTAVGEVPDATVRAVADAVRLGGSHDD